MTSEKLHVSIKQICAWKRQYGPGRDHVGLQSCQNGKKRKRCAAEVCARGIKNSLNGRLWIHSKPEIIWVQFIKKSKDMRHFQLLASAVGHGQLRKPLKNHTF